MTVGCNLNKPPIEITIGDWRKANEETGASAYKRDCPVCKEGMLLMIRNQQTFELSEVDFCVLCGQEFRYTDLKESGLI